MSGNVLSPFPASHISNLKHLVTMYTAYTTPNMRACKRASKLNGKQSKQFYQQVYTTTQWRNIEHTIQHAIYLHSLLPYKWHCIIKSQKCITDPFYRMENVLMFYSTLMGWPNSKGTVRGRSGSWWLTQCYIYHRQIEGQTVHSVQTGRQSNTGYGI